MRDIVLGVTIYHDFTTRAFDTGIPTVLANTPVLKVLEENNATPITAGVSVSVDRASVVGLNMATIVATGGNGYEAGKSYSIYISTGTVDGVSVIGEIVGQFTIQSAPVNWAKVTAPTTAVDLSATDIQLVDTATALTNVINSSSIVASISGNVDGNVTGTVADVVNLSNLPTIPTNWITAAGINAGALDGKGNWNINKTGYALTVADWNTVVPPSVSEFNARTILSAAYFDPAADTVANVTLVATTTDVTNGVNVTTIEGGDATDILLAAANAALDTAISELAQAIPSATPSIRNAVMLTYMRERNKFVTQTSGTDALEWYNDAGALIFKKLLTDDGSDYTEAEATSGP